MPPPLRRARPAFCIPLCATPSRPHRPPRALAAAAAALALTLLPCRPPPVLAAPPPPAASLSAPTLFDRDFLHHFQIRHASAPPAPLSLPPRPSVAAEIRVLTRLVVALVVGGCIGMERRAANSLAGVRTFSLVSLGAAIFMITILVAFPAADPARIAAAISSSVGFLGAGAMHKNAKHHRGLTTASSVWLAAALGIAAASGMFLLSFTGAVITVLIARYARFDSSLQLIRDDPSFSGLRDEPDGLKRHYAPNPTRSNGYEYAATRRRGDATVTHEMVEGPMKFEKGSGKAWTDPVHLQALVDYDPSSQAARDGDDDDLDDGNTA